MAAIFNRPSDALRIERSARTAIIARNPMQDAQGVVWTLYQVYSSWHYPALPICITYCKYGGIIAGAGEGNRTLVCSLGSCRSTIELRPRAPTIANDGRQRQAASRSLWHRRYTKTKLDRKLILARRGGFIMAAFGPPRALS